MAAPDDRVDRDALADACRRDLLADGINDAEEFMADNAGIFREGVMALIDMHIGPADPGKGDFHPDFVGARSGNRTGFDVQLAWLFDNDASHFCFFPCLFSEQIALFLLPYKYAIDHN